VLNNPLIFIDPDGLIWYYSSSEKVYKWFDDDPGKGWDKVNTFVVQSDRNGENYGWYALNPYAKEVSKRYDNEADAREQWSLYEFRYNAGPLSDAVAPIPAATLQFLLLASMGGMSAGAAGAGGLAVAGESYIVSQQMGIVSNDPLGLNEPTVAAGTIQSTGTIDPSQIRFAQESISPDFKDGRSIDALEEGLKSGRVNPDNVPPIRLVEHEGQLYTLDNRRLEAFQRAGVNVPYRMATPKEIAKEWPRKFTTKNNGTRIRIRGRVR
jgi:hypothetical protein